MSGAKQLVLGLFFLVAIGMLAFYTLFLTDLDLFGTPTRLEAQFPEAHGLREGDPVMVSGMRLGRVKSIVYDPKAAADRRIHVVMHLNQPLEIRAGHSVRIEETTLLGGRNVNIDPGPAEAAPLDLAVLGPLAGTIAANPLEALKDAGAVIAENRVRFGQVVANLETITSDVRDGKGPIGRLFKDEQLSADFSTAVADFAATMRETRQVFADVRGGKGSLGSLLNDDALYQTLKGAIENFSALSTDLRSGQGVFGKLVYDQELADRLASELDQTARNVRLISEELQSGRGTLGMLLKDDRIAQNVLRVSNEMADQRSTVGKLLNTSELYDKLIAISDDVRVVVGAVREKQGSLGELIMNKELYDEVLNSVRLLNRSLEDYREAAPVSTFTSVFFGAF
jgi:phospholipid/cholesterol/gamma-HCH transport system substrate-binding protein